MNVKNTKGFTILEVVIALFLFTMTIGAVMIFFVYYLRNYSFSFEENQLVNIAQSGMTQMIRHIREARNGENGAWPIVEAGNTSFTLFSDVTDDGRTDRVRYFVDGTDLKRGVVEPTVPPVTYPLGTEQITTIATNLNLSGASIFTYYNGNWPSDVVNNPLAAASRQLNTRYVTIYLKIDVQTNFGAQPYELSSGVQIRSMKDNL